MSDERLQILKMVQEGRLSPEEAARLLDAVGAPSGVSGPKPTHLRLKFQDGSKTRNFSVGVGFASWVLSLVSDMQVKAGGVQFDNRQLLDAIQRGTPGKIFEADEDGQRIEVWLDA